MALRDRFSFNTGNGTLQKWVSFVGWDWDKKIFSPVFETKTGPIPKQLQSPFWDRDQESIFISHIFKTWDPDALNGPDARTWLPCLVFLIK